MTMFEKYGVPSSGWAPGVARPSTERSGTCTGALGSKQVSWLNAKSLIFADANRRVEEVRAHAAEVAAAMPAPEKAK